MAHPREAFVNGSSPVVLVYDDSLTVPAEISSLTGVTSFGDMLRRRERLSTTIRSLSEEAGFGGMLHARRVEDLHTIAERARWQQDDLLYLLLPAHLAPTAGRRDAVHFLRKLGLLTEPVALWQGDQTTEACLVNRDGLLAYVAEAGVPAQERERYLRDYAVHLPPVEDALRLADLRQQAATLEFLSGSFSARHFNHVEQDRYHVVKRSRDRDKIRREYTFFRLLPEEMQPYFLQPFGYEEDADGASYRTRRLFVPDLAVQWIHGALAAPQFEQLLEHLFHFVRERPRREVGRDAARGHAEALYVAKVADRVAELLRLPAGRVVDETLVAGGVAGGVAALHERYAAAYERLSRRHRASELCVSHGDLCYSNILYSTSTQTFQLIDPRGADTDDEIYTDMVYDLAKLSHSVLGGYDFIVAGLFELVHTDDLRLSLRLDDGSTGELREMFVERLAAEGIDVDLVRVCEASLFLSMLPLHLDSPKRVTAFAVRAQEILAELEGRRAR